MSRIVAALVFLAAVEGLSANGGEMFPGIHPASGIMATK